MDWTLTYDGTTQTFEAWGLSQPVITSGNFEVGTVSFSHRAGTYDGEPLFAYAEAGVVKLGEVIVFQGTFASPKRSGSGMQESLGYTLRDAWWNLSRLPYVQSAAAIARIFTTQNLSEMFEAVVDYAEGLGVQVQFGSAANLGFKPLEHEVRDVSCAEMLRTLRKWCPDVQHHLDHTTTPPTIHFVRRADATALDLALEAVSNKVSISELDDQRVTQVVLKYTRTNQGEEGPEEETFVDVYPVLPLIEPGQIEGAVIATFDLRGKQKETQKLWTDNINPLSKAWWARRFPWALDATGDDYEITDSERKMQNSEGEWVDDTTGSVNEIVEGSVPGWLTEARQVLVKAVARDFTLDGVVHTEQELTATVQATSLAGGVYTRETFSGEAVPSGIAEAYYNAVSVLHYQGSVRFKAAELALPLPHVAMVLNLTGGEAAARGWTAMRAVIQSVAVDVQNAEVTLTFGPPEHLGPQDLMELSRMRGRGLEAQPAATGTSGGVRRASGSNSLPPKPSGTAAPLTVTADGKIVPGTIQGVIPTIGGTAIAALPAPALEIPATGVAHVVAGLYAVVTQTADGEYAESVDITEVRFAVLEDPPTAADLKSDGVVDPESPDTPQFKVLFATFVDGARTLQAWTGSQAYKFCDDSSRTGTAKLELPGS